MSGIDRAFIKAFRKDTGERHVASPHRSFSAAQSPPVGGIPVDKTPVEGVSAQVTAGSDVPTASTEMAGQNAADAPPATLHLPTAEDALPRTDSQLRNISVDAGHGSVSGPHWPTAQPAEEQPAPEASEPAPSWARPAYEVEQFIWPDVCRQLVSNTGGQLDAIAKILLKKTRSGHKSVYISGAGRGHGCTTVLLCLAQRLASIGVSCALVDADFERPGLVQSLGVAPVAGWEDVAREGHGIAEVMIQSQEDHLAVLPLRRPMEEPRMLMNDLHWPVTMSALKQQYQIVLVDGSSCSSESADTLLSLGPQASMDMAILVAADPDASLYELTDATNRLTAANIEVLGVVENLSLAAANSLQDTTSTAKIA